MKICQKTTKEEKEIINTLYKTDYWPHNGHTPALSPPAQWAWLWSNFSTPRSSSRSPRWCAAGGPGWPCTSPSDGSPVQKRRKDICYKINSKRERGRVTTSEWLLVLINRIDPLRPRCFYTHVNERGINIVRVLLASFDWNDHSVELVCQEQRETLTLTEGNLEELTQGQSQ